MVASAGPLKVTTGAVESSRYVAAAEHADTLPAASVAVARTAVVLSSITISASPVDPNAAAVPLATALPLQSEVTNNRTVDEASAAPITTGALLLAGDAGTTVTPDGAPGGVESSTYVTPTLHGDTFPSTSVACAYTTVVVLSATLIAIPGDANVAAEPDATELAQSAVRYSRTVAPCSAVPLTLGVF